MCEQSKEIDVFEDSPQSQVKAMSLAFPSRLPHASIFRSQQHSVPFISVRSDLNAVQAQPTILSSASLSIVLLDKLPVLAPAPAPPLILFKLLLLSSTSVLAGRPFGLPALPGGDIDLAPGDVGDAIEPLFKFATILLTLPPPPVLGGLDPLGPLTRLASPEACRAREVRAPAPARG